MKKKIVSVMLFGMILLLGTAFAFGESNEIKFKRYWEGNVIKLNAESTVKTLYIEFNEEPGAYTIEGAGTVQAGQHGFLHEFIDLGDAASDTLKLCFSKRISVKGVYAFDGPDTPDWVEKWELPYTESDLLLIASHADDEQLFFAGILPYYTQCKDLRVQVLYATDHVITSGRQHERLKGLWDVGVRHYPLSLGWSDYYSESPTLALEGLWEIGLTAKKAEEYLKDAIEDCKPQVIVTHDLKGEYGHGMHRLVSRSMLNILYGTEGFTNAGLPQIGQEPSAEAKAWLEQNSYLKKVYLHSFNENQIVLGFMDEPFEELGGLTPFQVTQQLGFPAHVSQQWTWFKGWINGANNQIKNASEIKTYNPAYYGLVYTAAGEDVQKNDFFENVKSRTVLEEEAEAARIAEEQRITKEKEEAYLAEQNKLAAERLAAKKRRTTTFSLIAVAVMIVIVAALFIILRNKSRRKYEER